MPHPDAAELEGWVGRSEVRRDRADAGAAARLAALLDLPEGVWAGTEVAPLGHWLQFLPCEAQSQLSPDGHPESTALLPARPRERRMWAGGRVEFHAPIRFGAELERRSEVARIQVKAGGTGELVFVTLRHTISADSGVAVVEEQDLVYRDPPKGAAPAAEAGPDGPLEVDWRVRYDPDPIKLFRYSALTFNAHRIHYDRDYAREVEGYPALVVHGPLTATLLITAWLRRHPGARPGRFSFRSRRPLFDTAAFELCGAGDGGLDQLWAVDGEGRVSMAAEVDGRLA